MIFHSKDTHKIFSCEFSCLNLNAFKSLVEIAYFCRRNAISNLQAKETKYCETYYRPISYSLLPVSSTFVKKP